MNRMKQRNPTEKSSFHVVSIGNNTVAGKLAVNPLLALTVSEGALTLAGVVSGDDDLVKDAQTLPTK